MRGARQGLSRAVMFIGIGLLPACGALLDFPDTREDDNYGKPDSGFYADGAPIGDGNVGGDGTTGGDGSSSGDGSSGGDATTFMCSAGVCTITDKVIDPQNIVNDGMYLYVISGSDKVVRVDPATGDTKDIATGQNALAELAVAPAGNEVFFTNKGAGGTGTDGAVTRCSTDGCMTEQYIYVSGSPKAFDGISVQGTEVYFTVEDTTGARGGGLYECPATGTSCTVTSPFQAVSGPGPLDSNTTTLFWSTSSGSAVNSCSLPGCSSPGSGQEFSAVTFAIDNMNAYIATSSEIEYQPLGSLGATPLEVAGSQSNNVAVAGENGTVYWLAAGAGNNGTLNKCAASPGCTDASHLVAQLANGLRDASHLTILGNYVYFTTRTDSMIWRVAK